MTHLTLHEFSKSSASYRVRIALNLKGLTYESVSWVLRAGAHRSPEFTALNPHQLVPVLDVGDGGAPLSQSLAILEYLDTVHPLPRLIPEEARAAARVRSLALSVAADIHPLNNLRVLAYLKDVLKVDQAGADSWYQHWVQEGFRGFEAQLTRDAQTGRFCHGDEVTLADVCLVPQVYNARRFNVPLDAFPKLSAIATACESLPAFSAAHPHR